MTCRIVTIIMSRMEIVLMTLETRTLGAQGPELTTIGSGLPRSYSLVVGAVAGCVSTLVSTLRRRRAGSVEVRRTTATDM